MNAEEMEMHYATIASAMSSGKIIPFLGAGVNLCDRGDDKFEPGVNLPSGGELTAHLVEVLKYPPNKDLMNLSQYIVVAGLGSSWLYETLRGLFNRDYPPTLLHKLLAVLPKAWRDERRGRLPFQIIVTTNYDDVLERTLFACRQPFDVLTYIATGEDRGKFRHSVFAFRPEPPPALEPRREGQSEEEYAALARAHEDRLAAHLREQTAREERFWRGWPPEVASEVIREPEEYTKFAFDERPVVLKIHGAVNRYEEDLDSYVITEDDYIEYLIRTDISQFVPAVVAARMVKSHFWFLGYSLRDWNLRVILRRIWGEQKRKNNSWAVQLNPERLEEKSWTRRDVDIINSPLHHYTHGLIRHLKLLPHVAELNRRLRGPGDTEANS